MAFEDNHKTARPEEPPSLGGVSKGARWRKSTGSQGDFGLAVAREFMRRDQCGWRRLGFYLRSLGEVDDGRGGKVDSVLLANED